MIDITASLLQGAVDGTALPTAAWDLSSFLKNGTTSLKGWLNLALLGLGVLLVGCSAIIGGIKFFNSQMRFGWGKIFAMFFFGGVLMITGFTTISQIAAGANDTVLDMGDGSAGTIVAGSLNSLASGALAVLPSLGLG